MKTKYLADQSALVPNANPPAEQFSLVRITSLIAWSVGVAETSCPMSDAALADIESAANALYDACSYGHFNTDAVGEICAHFGEVIAEDCANGLPSGAKFAEIVAEMGF